MSKIDYSIIDGADGPTSIFIAGQVGNIYDITVPQGANVSKVKRDNANLRCHYVRQEVYELGITEVQTPQGAMVKVYDKERCICDLIRDKEQMDMQIYAHAIKAYFKAKPNYRKLLKYGKVFEK